MEADDCMKNQGQVRAQTNPYTHMPIPLVNFGSIVISSAFSSRGFRILKMANTLAIIDHTDVSAKCLPTQIRRPNPYTMCSMSLGLREPSSLRNRSGMNACGLGYLDSSCAIDLGKRAIMMEIRFQKDVFYTDHRFARRIAPKTSVLIDARSSGKSATQPFGM